MLKRLEVPAHNLRHTVSTKAYLVRDKTRLEFNRIPSYGNSNIIVTMYRNLHD